MRLKNLAGAEGFEPSNAGTKNRCLTTWRRPITTLLLSLIGGTLSEKVKDARWF